LKIADEHLAVAESSNPDTVRQSAQILPHQ
jgi:hypothetical protein